MGKGSRENLPRKVARLTALHAVVWADIPDEWSASAGTTYIPEAEGRVNRPVVVSIPVRGYRTYCVERSTRRYLLDLRSFARIQPNPARWVAEAVTSNLGWLAQRCLFPKRRRQLEPYAARLAVERDAPRIDVWRRAIRTAAFIALADLDGSPRNYTFRTLRTWANRMGDEAARILQEERSRERAARRSDIEIPPEAAASAWLAAGASADRVASEFELREEMRIRRQRAGLSERQAQVWELRYTAKLDERFTPGEIARELDIEVSTVHVHLHNARRKLREAL